jgi:beta-lactamase regulating signal transducer with metallopeptidase domain
MTEVTAFIAGASLRGCILMAISFAALAVGGRRNPRMLEATWKTTCVALLVLPFLLLLPPLPVPGVTALRSPAVAGTLQVAPEIDDAAAPWRNVRYERPSKANDFIIPIWLTGTFAVLGWFAWGAMSLRRIVRSASPAGDVAREASLDIEVLESSAISTPMTVALFRPVILLPSSSRQWTRSQVHAAIAHETAHVRRHDAAWMNLAWTVCALYWFHPAAWFVRSRLRLAAEMASDEAAAKTVGRSNYISALADIAARSVHSSVLRFTHAMAGRSMLGVRIDALLTRRRASPGGRIAPIVGALLVAVIAISTRAHDSTFLMSDPVARQLVMVSDSPDARIRCNALFKLARWRGREEHVLPILLAHLGDSAPVNEMPQWNYLREGWQPALASFQQPSPGELAALGIASFGSLAARELEARLNHPDPVVRRNAAWAIGEMRHPRRLSPGTAPLLFVLLHDPESSVRSAAAWTVGDLGLEDGLAPLRRALRQETDPRAAAFMRKSVAALEAGLNLEYFRTTARR